MRHLVALVLQMQAQQIGDRLIVLDDQHPFDSIHELFPDRTVVVHIGSYWSIVPQSRRRKYHESFTFT